MILVSQKPIGLGSTSQVIELGRIGNRQIAFLKDPTQVRGQNTITESILTNNDKKGIEFVRQWNSAGIAVIVMSPFTLSLLFMALWIGLCLRYRPADDFQAIISTASTTGSYIVTVGW